MITTLKIATIQMISTNHLQANLSKMQGFVEQAKAKGAEIVVFPELASFYGAPEECVEVARQYPTLLKEFARWAREYQIGIIPGSLREPVSSTSLRYYNTLPVFDASGSLLGTYRKLFLFKACLPDRNYDESERVEKGKEIVIADFPWGKLGLSICYDLRFPELFRRLRKAGASVVVVPSAFTVPTGKAHWHALLKARAIENQIFIVAPGLTGTAGDGSAKYGHSLIFSPWGDSKGELTDREGLLYAELDLSEGEQCRRKLDCWESRREEIFPL